MEYRSLGQTGLKVSSLCLGAMTFGEADSNSFMHKVSCDEATAFAIMDRAEEAGINFIDTADVYGQDGLSERVVGRWLNERKNRNRTVLATKFRFRMGEGPNGTGASRYRIRQCVEDSLRRLNTDRIDLYQIHMQDADTPEEETLRALSDLVTQGKILYIGCSNYAAYRLALSLATSAQQQLSAFATMQMQYSLICRDIEREHVPLAAAKGLGLLPWSPLAAGFLTGKYTQGQSAPAGTRLDQWKERFAAFDRPRNWVLLEAVREIARAHKTTETAVSLAWVLSRKTVSSAIFGARTVEQLNTCLASVDLVLDQDDLNKLDAASKLEMGYPYDFIQRIQGRW
jgi:aryl-alcohol dehydrogenase-like predicted oxidoreductase